MSRADVVRQRHPCLAVMLANKTALVAEAQLDETRITYDDPLQSQQFIVVEGWRPASPMARPHR